MKKTLVFDIVMHYLDENFEDFDMYCRNTGTSAQECIDELQETINDGQEL